MILARIPKLESQWRIIHDFKPTEYLQAADPTRPHLGLYFVTGDRKSPGNSAVGLYFPFPKILLNDCIRNDNNQIQLVQEVESTQLPKIGEWTRVEIGHEKVEEKYFLFLSVGGREVGREEVTDPRLKNLTDVKVRIGHSRRVQP